MDQFKRDQILDNINGCKLTAEVAVAARNDEVCEHLRSIIDALHIPEKIEIKPADDELRTHLPRVKMTMAPDADHTYPIVVNLDFSYSNGVAQPQLNIESLAYKAFYAGNNACMMLKAANAIADKLDEIYAHINSDIFKAYEADIQAYVDACLNLKQFDNDAREEKIKQTAMSFRADQVLKDKQGVTHLVRKATNKRLWLSDWHYYNGAAKQSEDKMLIAQWVVDGNWSICV